MAFSQAIVDDPADGLADPVRVVLPNALQDTAAFSDVVRALVRIPEAHARHDVIEVEVVHVLASSLKIIE